MGAVAHTARGIFVALLRGHRLILLLPLFVMFSPTAAANDLLGTSLERQIKAAMLYKFLGYVEWPPESFTTPLAPYVIGVAGASDVIAELRQITVDRTVNHRPILVQKVTSKSELSQVHLLFIGEDNSEVLHNRLMRRAREHSVVTVTENEKGLKSGSVINFRLIDDRIGFDVSLVNAGTHKLKLSARLLAVASYVETDNQ